jgi:hypothetical protein
LPAATIIIASTTGRRTMSPTDHCVYVFWGGEGQNRNVNPKALTKQVCVYCETAWLHK